ncbi:Uncharacterized protein TCM_004606 [Theobroma cacao]|uniref:Uncharacterized protein n=1 Tax=Theobroma cacao TaxID=3641 RepID=A0A061DQC9_THECC|nr:Uncharacterized protein TCM_004606 [Theobroma cacao]
MKISVGTPWRGEEGKGSYEPSQLIKPLKWFFFVYFSIFSSPLFSTFLVTPPHTQPPPPNVSIEVHWSTVDIRPRPSTGCLFFSPAVWTARSLCPFDSLSSSRRTELHLNTMDVELKPFVGCLFLLLTFQLPDPSTCSIP